jgi:WhiB family redox-sensing transcriptional regulator
VNPGTEARRLSRLAKKELTEGAWRERSACREVPTYVMYNDAEPLPDGRPRPPYNDAKAKAVCKPCPVRDICLDLALRANDIHGMHGGMNTDEQRSERRRRVRARTLHPTTQADVDLAN